MLNDKIYALGKKLYPLNRSITGKETLKSLKLIKKEIPRLKIKFIKSKIKIFDWVVPSEWNVKKAYVIDKFGKKIIDLKNHNLHLVGYSVPVKKKINKDQLLQKIYSLKKQRNAIPYVTSYYKKHWGFCTTHNQKKEIERNYKSKDKFSIVIDSSFNNKGKLNYGEVIIPGKEKKEILISTYICHPQMANNELSGPLVTTALVKYFFKKKNNKTLRFIFVPETIGSIAYIKKNLEYLKRYTIGGYVLSCIGDDKEYSLISTKYGNSNSDFAAIQAFKKLKINYKKYSFLERGSDERQFNSPGVDLPIASILRTKYGEYPEYHTSLDNFKLVTKKGLNGGFKVSKTAIENLLNYEIPFSKYLCEPKLQKKNLYNHISFKGKSKKFSRNLLNFLQYADGKNNLQKISKLIKLSSLETRRIWKILKKNKLVN